MTGRQAIPRMTHVSALAIACPKSRVDGDRNARAHACPSKTPDSWQNIVRVATHATITRNGPPGIAARSRSVGCVMSVNEKLPKLSLNEPPGPEEWPPEEWPPRRDGPIQSPEDVRPYTNANGTERVWEMKPQIGRGPIVSAIEDDIAESIVAEAIDSLRDSGCDNCGEPHCDICAHKRELSVVNNPCPTCRGTGLGPLPKKPEQIAQDDHVELLRRLKESGDR